MELHQLGTLIKDTRGFSFYNSSSLLGHIYGNRIEKSKLVLKIFIMLFHVYVDLESINMSGSRCSISSQTFGAGAFGGVVVGLVIGAVISCVTTKIVWGAPNMKRCQ